MTDKEQAVAFAGDLMNVVDRYRSEFELSTVAAVGVLHLIAHTLLQEVYEQTEDGEDIG